uniref:NADH-ubiquinone oxidoreductase chain 6 n=1 Tax=Penicillium citrinum TaxID=5077 RepID=A0A6H1XFK9_PENCI|nr:NADH dehydrogenase subunit 6 [Penicillium citrinum]QJA14308.1 NADH dehydrogenase subunit 6 [Penicillium citrinum]QUL58712.1 NADH dehydrogenase subunit 6 [Penicillium sp.]
MYNIFLLNDNITNGFSAGLPDIIYVLALLLAYCTIASKNPIVSVLYLIALFVNIASLLILVGYNFLGLSYILVYVGAISILFLFILMLINIRTSEITHNTRKDTPLIIGVGASFIMTITQALPTNLTEFAIFSEIAKTYVQSSIEIDNESVKIMDLKQHMGFASSKGWDNSLVEATHIEGIGNIMYTNYAIWLIVSSMILLTGMVGAIVITIKQKQ